MRTTYIPPCPLDDFRNETNENNENKVQSESAGSCHRRTDEQQSRSLVGGDGDNDDNRSNFHNQPPQTTTAASSSSSSLLPRPPHDSIESIPSNPTNSSTASTVAASTIVMGEPATRRRTSTSSSISDCFSLGLLVVLMVLFFVIILFYLEYWKFTDEWTLRFKDDDVGGVKSDRSTSTDVNGNTGTGPRIGIAGNVLKGILNNVLLKHSSTSFMSPPMTGNGNIQQSHTSYHHNDDSSLKLALEKSSHHRSPLAFLRQWIQQAIIRFDEHRNRHQVNPSSSH